MANVNLLTCRLRICRGLPLQLLLATSAYAVQQGQVVEVMARGRMQTTKDSGLTKYEGRLASFAERRSISVDSEFLDASEEPVPAAHAEAVPDQIPIKPNIATMAGGVANGACKNFQKSGSQEATATCPPELKMTSCSCEDKVGEKNGGCGTKFSNLGACTAYTKLTGSVAAYARCCHMDWASSFTIKNGPKSASDDGASSVAQCDPTHELLGCACMPGDTPNNGCKRTEFRANSSCIATNLKDHPAGVTAQALCAILPNSTGWETVGNNNSGQDASTNLSCSESLQMIGCSCGSEIGHCLGGKVIAERCHCNGAACIATARCANIPVPPRDCIWNVWGQWSDCSVSCGNGTMSRVREMALVASDGGALCQGPVNQTMACISDTTKKECAPLPEKVVVVVDSGFCLLSFCGQTLMFGGIGLGIVVLLIVGVAVYSYSGGSSKGEFNGEGEGEFGGAPGAYGEASAGEDELGVAPGAYW